MFWLSSIIDTKSAGWLWVCLYKESGQELHKAQEECAGVGAGRSGPFPERAGCFCLCLASGIDMAYSFPQSKKELQRLKHTLGWLLMRLFCLFIHFKIYMTYFSLRTSGCLCLIRLEGLQFKITYAAWCPISLYDFGNKADYRGFMCKQIRDRCKHSYKPCSCFLSTNWIPPSSGSFYIKCVVCWL